MSVLSKDLSFHKNVPGYSPEFSVFVIVFQFSFCISQSRRLSWTRSCGVKSVAYPKESWPLIRALGLGQVPLEDVFSLLRLCKFCENHT